MKDLKWGYYEHTVANFFFSFDQNQDGLIDDAEKTEAYIFWSSTDQVASQHKLLGEMCFANM